MAKKHERMIAGVWDGELIDKRGFQAKIRLVLHRIEKGNFCGTFEIGLQARHQIVRRSGPLMGKPTERGALLAFETKEFETSVEMDASVCALRGGGFGMTGTYRVAARGHTTLRGGVLCARRDSAPSKPVRVPSSIVARAPKSRPAQRGTKR